MQSAGTVILTVDEDEEIREPFKECLGGLGYVCHTAPSSDGALDLLATEAVDLVLLDIMMPGTTGRTLFESIFERSPDTTVNFITAMNDLEVAVGKLKPGACDYLVKPVSSSRLAGPLKTCSPDITTSRRAGESRLLMTPAGPAAYSAVARSGRYESRFPGEPRRRHRPHSGIHGCSGRALTPVARRKYPPGGRPVKDSSPG